MTMEYSHLTSEHKDVLREIGNIGAGNAATSMSALINRKIEMEVPTVNIVAFDEVMELVGGPETPVTAILITIKGDVSGKVFFILPIEEAEEIACRITGNTEFRLSNDDSVETMAISALQEVGNILTGSYISALSDFTNLAMQPSIPYLSSDMAGAVLTAGLIDLSRYSDYAIIIETTINDQSKTSGIHGHFLFLPDPESFPKIFTALGMEHNE